MIGTSKTTFLYNFLTDSKFRIWKHMLLILSMAIISGNQVFMAYQDCMDVLGNHIYWLCLSMLLVYLALAYLNIYVLAPRLLLEKKYAVYIVTLALLVAILPLNLMLVQEYLLRSMLDLPHRFDSYTHPLALLSNLSILMIMLICFSGTSISMFFRNWIEESKHVSQLEKEHIQSEVDQLKDQITPDFLSKILNKTSVLAKTEPAKASDMLMRLGQLLRYQLYDCSRERVLLSAEIQFLTNYLDLEKLYSSQFDYKIEITGDINQLFVSPLLFISFVQYAVSRIHQQEEHILLKLSFSSEDERVIFLCKFENGEQEVENDFKPIRQRLSLLYDVNYSLTVTKGMIKLQLNQWDL